MFFLIAMFAIVNSPNGDYAVEYTGMTQATIISMELNRGNVVNFVDKNTYQQFVSSKNVPIPVDTVRDKAKQIARGTVKSGSSTQVQKVDALILLLDLDK